MRTFDVVIDTNVLFSALYSSNDASHKLLSLIGESNFTIHVSVPLILEYEEKLKEKRKLSELTVQDIDDVIDYLCAVGVKHNQIDIFWRPCLNDPDDEMILELGVHANVDYIVTHNIKDFKIKKETKLQPITPKAFLNILKKRV